MATHDIRKLRETVRFYLTDHQSATGKLFDIVFLILNLIFVGLYVADTYTLSTGLDSLLWQAEVGIAVLFVGEYLLRLFAAPDRGAFITDIYSVIDLVAIAPTLLLAFGPGAIGLHIGFLKVVRVLRIFRFYRLTQDEEFFFGTVSTQMLQVLKLALTIAVIFFISAGVFHSVEAGANPDVANFGNAFYFMVVALTTVGFGDIVPATQIGRSIVLTAIFVSYIIIPYQTTRIARAWRGGSGMEHPCPNCGQEKHPADASYCKRCGSHLFDRESDSITLE